MLKWDNLIRIIGVSGNGRVGKPNMDSECVSQLLSLLQNTQGKQLIRKKVWDHGFSHGQWACCFWASGGRRSRWEHVVEEAAHFIAQSEKGRRAES
jgi:hypothetical protein